MSFRTLLIDMLRRQWRLRIVISVAALLIMAGAIGSYLRLPRKAQVSTPRGGEAIFNDLSQTAFDYGIIRETRLVLPDEREFAIRIHDFDAHFYTPGENQVTDESKLMSSLLEHQKDFEDSWVVIFAGASFEGMPEKNLDLCRCRVWNVARFMLREGINNRGYWSIPAGEFRLKTEPDDSTGDEGESETAEEEEARLGESGLSSQRRLLVVTVKPLQQETGDSAQACLNEVVEALGAKALLPTNYDKGTANPVALDPTDENNPCPTRRRSIKGKIKRLLERLLHQDSCVLRPTNPGRFLENVSRSGFPLITERSLAPVVAT